MYMPLRNRRGDVVGETQVDPRDAFIFGPQRWSLTGDKRYVQGWINKEVVYLHRAIMGLKRGDKRQVDHINGDRLDNRRENLRIVDHAENLQHRVKPCSNNTSGYRGVWWNKNDQRWSANVEVRGKRYRKAYFNTAKEASEWAEGIRRMHMGEFA